MPSASHRRAPRAVLFDLDGTLYFQRPLRVRMLAELARTPFSRPRRALSDLRRLQTFRAVREELRELGRPEEPLEELQYARPAARLGVEAAAVRETVREWIHERPLRHMPACRRPGLSELLAELGALGLRIGVFSDYPAEDKLRALGVRDHFDLLLCATDPEVNAFKPHPRGFELAAERWGLDVGEVLYVGDRPEVDGAGARAAGMPVVVLAPRPPGGERGAAGIEFEEDLGRALHDVRG